MLAAVVWLLGSVTWCTRSSVQSLARDGTQARVVTAVVLLNPVISFSFPPDALSFLFIFLFFTVSSFSHAVLRIRIDRVLSKCWLCYYRLYPRISLHLHMFYLHVEESYTSSFILSFLGPCSTSKFLS